MKTVEMCLPSLTLSSLQHCSISASLIGFIVCLSASSEFLHSSGFRGTELITSTRHKQTLSHSSLGSLSSPPTKSPLTCHPFQNRGRPRPQQPLTVFSVRGKEVGWLFVTSFMWWQWTRYLGSCLAEVGYQCQNELRVPEWSHIMPDKWSETCSQETPESWLSICPFTPRGLIVLLDTPSR